MGGGRERERREWRKKLREERRENREDRMEDAGDGTWGRPWQTGDPAWDSDWVDFQDKDAIPLLEGEKELLLNPDTPPEWPEPWNVHEGNPLKFEEWKLWTDLLSDRERIWNMLVDTGLLLNNPINVTPISKPLKSADLFGVTAEPNIEPSDLYGEKK